MFPCNFVLLPGFAMLSSSHTMYRTIDSTPTSTGGWTWAQSLLAASGVCICMGAAFLAGEARASSQSQMYALTSQVASAPSVVLGTAVQRGPGAYVQRTQVAVKATNQFTAAQPLAGNSYLQAPAAGIDLTPVLRNQPCHKSSYQVTVQCFCHARLQSC